MVMRALLIFTLLVTVPEGGASEAAVAMPDSWSAEAAVEVLRDGGNAVDAAVAAAFVLTVTYPEAGNIGGGGFMTSYVEGEAAFLDFREKAPAGAYREMYLDAQGEFRQRLSLIGGLASGVPGTVKGLQAAHQRYGKLPWQRLLAPAIKLASGGFEIPSELALMAREKVVFDAGETNFVRYFGEMAAGEVFRQPELAATLRLLAGDPDAFYHGLPARQLVAQMQRSGGLVTLEDLANYEAIWREPVQARWRGLSILSAPPPSSGGFALAQLLKMRDFSDSLFTGVAHNSGRYVHLLAELEKRVFADRATFLGDPDFVQVPLQRLLSDDYLNRRARGVNPEGISDEIAPVREEHSVDTTHFSILDGKGNAVSLTYTLNWEFGSGVVVEGAGYLLNNQMDDFSAKPGVPNAFGVIGNERNAIAPGKRMLSSMSPTILLREGRPELVIGTPGGSTIFTSIFQVILNLYDFDMPLQQAVDALRFHHQLPQAKLVRHDQRQIPEGTQQVLERLGYQVQANDWGDLGDIQAVFVTGGGVEASADSRGRGSAVVLRAAP